MKRFLKPWRIVIYIIWIIVLSNIFSSPTIVFSNEPQEFSLAEWWTVRSVWEDLWLMKQYRFRNYFNVNEERVRGIQPWTYLLEWSYTPSELLEFFEQWPQTQYTTVTLLEGWSIYDVDAKLVQLGMIQEWEYVEYVSDQEVIAWWADQFAFIQQALDEKWSLQSLEGYLYPETYAIDLKVWSVLQQLVLLQLRAFNSTIRKPYGSQLITLNETLQNDGYQFWLSSYWAITLASVVEKEERVDANKPTISSVFYNRLDSWMRIDADITLCYWLEVLHTDCTPSLIVANLTDASNPYNTRAVWGLPPTPITSPTVSSVEWLLEAQPSNNVYYLHDPTGQIHVAETLLQHNSNKSKYLQ